ncbi:hypothetical protein DL769_002504 [Monosporascus sp. CRB-8-3]|nr:hypothetical protein DL769_002504 [Monosporascus sp. CRB-8-3]
MDGAHDAAWPDVGALEISTPAHIGKLQSDLVSLGESAHILLAKVQQQADLAVVIETVSRIDRTTQAIREMTLSLKGDEAPEAAVEGEKLVDSGPKKLRVTPLDTDSHQIRVFKLIVSEKFASELEAKLFVTSLDL